VLEADIILYGSFAETYRGHGTHLALLGGLLGFDPDDVRIRESEKLAAQFFRYSLSTGKQLPSMHPNTVRLRLRGESSRVEVVGESVGGGRVRITEIDGFPVHLDGESVVLIVHSIDRPGVITALTSCLARASINIGNMSVSRQGKGASVVMTIEVDAEVDRQTAALLSNVDGVSKVTQIVPL
jgi:L-serine dehydratase